MERREIDMNYTDCFEKRHIGPNAEDISKMLKVIGYQNTSQLIDATVPKKIRISKKLDLPKPLSEFEVIQNARSIAGLNQIFRTFIGMGYSDTITPPVIQRNVLENPGWYTQYTPYQAEISQGRLEALLNFQTLIKDMTGLPIANASMLDEGTAAAEAMTLFYSNKGRPQGGVFFVSSQCFPQTISVVKTRARPLGIEVVVGNHETFTFSDKVFGALVQYPHAEGAIVDYRKFIEGAHQAGALVAMAADLLALTLLIPPGELGADVALGNTQRFGVPFGYGGPHAAYFSTKEEFKRLMPGRIVGVSQDAEGRQAIRLALQTREQHIRRDKATSNICTSQVLLAVMASMYAVYHGPKGLKQIAERVRRMTVMLSDGLKALGYST
ncbi:MAG: glycine dehydrogenase (aminomethyl-transferring), partial [Bdellovibrionota bacterium]